MCISNRDLNDKANNSRYECYNRIIQKLEGYCKINMNLNGNIQIICHAHDSASYSYHLSSHITSQVLHGHSK